MNAAGPREEREFADDARMKNVDKEKSEYEAISPALERSLFFSFD